MSLKPLRLTAFKSKIESLASSGHLLKQPMLSEMYSYIDSLNDRLKKTESTWDDFEAFWPPRYVEGLIQGEAIVFFGAGISMPCGIPSWNKLLVDNLGLDKSFAEDDDLSSDPLTMAELAAQHLGSEKLQDVLRRIMEYPKEFSINHVALCALRCPFYITTNYDCLFEDAWDNTNPKHHKLIVVTTDSDLSTADYRKAISGNGSILFKIHGSARKIDEPMVLTRRDYRYHYRVNDAMFNQVRTLLKTKHTLFLGFGHRDPEISRLVDDAIHQYEESLNPRSMPKSRPQFYSLQFDMKKHTAEVYAARGIVALKPPAVVTQFEDIRSKALAVALVDLIAAKHKNLHAKESLDRFLKSALDDISNSLLGGLDRLSKEASTASNALLGGKSKNNWLGTLCGSLGELASQRVYLLDEDGDEIDHAVPDGLNGTLRGFSDPLNKRPYFQQAKFYRKPFVSNSAKSTLNQNSTIFLCLPIIDSDDQMIGLLFSACQIGQRTVPLDAAKKIWAKGLSFLLVDANGSCLLPPLNEFPTRDQSVKGGRERKGLNTGYSFDQLLVLSRRDVLVRHIGLNVVPVAQDDDVLELHEDLRQYTVIGKIPDTSLKLGISVSVQADS